MNEAFKPQVVTESCDAEAYADAFAGDSRDPGAGSIIHWILAADTPEKARALEARVKPPSDADLSTTLKHMGLTDQEVGKALPALKSQIFEKKT